MNKVIFLDIDGVLNSNFWNDSHQKEISEAASKRSRKADGYVGKGRNVY